MRLLVIEDQPLLREVLVSNLEHGGYMVDAFDSVEEGERHGVDLARYEIAILDITLPGESGLAFATRLRQRHPSLGIILLTMHDSLDMKLEGYESGADFYLIKPVDPLELIATIKALQKRLNAGKAVFTKVLFNPVKQKVYQEQGETQALSRNEVKILQAFIEAENFTLERWQLHELMKLNFAEKDRKNLEVIISRLRQKLKKFSTGDDVIKSIRGKGYQLTVRITKED